MTVRGKKGYHHGALRRALMEAALVLVEEKGPHGFALAEAARLAEVSPPATYRHFVNRADLLAAVAVDGFERLQHALQEAAASEPDEPVARLDALAFAYLDFTRNNGAACQVMFNAGIRDAGDSGRGALQPLIDCLADLDRGGRLNVDRQIALQASWAIIHGAGLLRAGGMKTYPASTRQLQRTLRTALFGGILRDPPESPAPS